MEQGDEQEARDGAEDGVEDEIVGEEGYAEGVLLQESCVSMHLASRCDLFKVGAYTLSAPINPNTLSTFAKWRYQLKLLARWYASSGNWANSRDDRTLLVSVAIATTRVIVLFECGISLPL